MMMPVPAPSSSTVASDAIGLAMILAVVRLVGAMAPTVFGSKRKRLRNRRGLVFGAIFGRHDDMNV